jgi:uncharacterized protein YecE (DUF72 family)
VARLTADNLTAPARKWRRQNLHIGISGWTYPPWRGVFYPKKLAHRLELQFASREFNSIEINGSFYSLQRPSSYRRWYSDTPPGFVFSVKGARFITHMKKLRDVDVSGYSDNELDWWANRIEHWRKGKQPHDAKLVTDRKSKAGKRDVYIYFDNDAKVHAPFNAKTLAKKLQLQGVAI